MSYSLYRCRARQLIPPVKDHLQVSEEVGLLHKKGLVGIVVWVLLLVVTAMILAAILDFIPWNIRRYFAPVVVPLAILWFLWSWFKWHMKQRSYQNLLDCLEETVLEHEQALHAPTGKYSFSFDGAIERENYLKEQIYFIELHKHYGSWGDSRPGRAEKLLARARRAASDPFA